MKRTIENCSLKKRVGEAGTEVHNGKVYCQGFARSEYDDEPCEKCKACKLNVWYEESDGGA